MSLPPNIILVGFMGSGKTVTGREISEILGFHFWDMDEWIEQRTNQKIPELFEKKGEAFFRRQENEAVLWLRKKKNYIVSTGGGTWIQEENRKALLEMGWCIWLKVSAEDVWRRVGNRLKQRPLLEKAEDPKQTIKSLLDERNPYYSLAHKSFDTSGKSPKQVALAVVKVFKENKPFLLA